MELHTKRADGLSWSVSSGMASFAGEPLILQLPLLETLTFYRWEYWLKATKCIQDGVSTIRQGLKQRMPSFLDMIPTRKGRKVRLMVVD